MLANSVHTKSIIGQNFVVDCLKICNYTALCPSESKIDTSCDGTNLRGVAKDVSDDVHGELWRVDVSVADHELLQYVILDRPSQLVRTNSLKYLPPPRILA